MLSEALAHWISCFQSVLVYSLLSPSVQTGIFDAYTFRLNSLSVTQRNDKYMTMPLELKRQSNFQKREGGSATEAGKGEKPTLGTLLSWTTATPSPGGP